MSNWAPKTTSGNAPVRTQYRRGRGRGRGGRGRGRGGYHTTSKGANKQAQQANKIYDALGTFKRYNLVDIGANIAHKRFQKDYPEMLKRAETFGVSKIVITGTSVKSSRTALKLAEKHGDAMPALFATAGVHPHDAKSCDNGTMQLLEDFAQSDKVVAIGECGLDYNRLFSTAEEQKLWFEEQLKLAAKLKMPVFLHERDAHKDFVEILKKYMDVIPGACVHCFTGTKEQLEVYINMGCHIGITGWVSDKKRGDTLRDIVHMIPLNKLMIETDCPFLTPHNMPQRSSRNEPCFLPFVLKQLAISMGKSEETIALETTKTANQFFNIKSTKD